MGDGRCLVPLTKGQQAIIDGEDAERVSRYSWYALRDKTLGVFRARRTYRANGKCQHQCLHNFILGDPPTIGMIPDHKDRNPLNNVRSNLRWAERLGNSRNVSKRRLQKGRPPSSKYIGVGMKRSSGKWIAYIRLNGRSHHIGTFLSEVDAAHAYDAAARVHFGAFANLNFSGPHREVA